MKIQTLAESSAATAAIGTMDGFQQPIQSLILGIVSVLITKAFAWLARRKK
jgi:hypothetical protein